MRKLETLKKQSAAESLAFDEVILPTSSVMPPNLERLETDNGYNVSENRMALRYTCISN